MCSSAPLGGGAAAVGKQADATCGGCCWRETRAAPACTAARCVMLRPGPSCRRRPAIPPASVRLACVTAFLIALAWAYWRWVPEASGAEAQPGPSGRAPDRPDTLVTYVFSNTDPESLGNLAYYVRHGIRAGDGADHIIVLQVGGSSPAVDTSRFALPPNARFVEHPNECYDWGTFGWLLGSGHVRKGAYSFFVLVNSSVRGPFLPPDLAEAVTWHRRLTGRLGGEVRLAGPVISCEGTPWQGDAGGEWRTHPHVQSYALATDRVGLGVLEAEGRVLACYSDRWDAIWHAELGASGAILAAGHNLASLLPRYRGVDWRDKANWGCNGGRSPLGDGKFNGTTLLPYDVVFAKVKGGLLRAEDACARMAAQYTAWAAPPDAGRPGSVRGNAFLEDPGAHQSPRVAQQLMRGPACFDAGFYRRASGTELLGLPEDELWHHFVYVGQFEGRAHRFTCEWPMPDELEAPH